MCNDAMTAWIDQVFQNIWSEQPGDQRMFEQKLMIFLMANRGFTLEFWNIHSDFNRLFVLHIHIKNNIFLYNIVIEMFHTRMVQLRG
jgi:hypothetical protein